MKSSFLLLFLSFTLSATAQKNAVSYFSMPAKKAEVLKTEKQSFTLQTVVEGMDVIWGMTFLPDGRMLFTERAGRLRLVEKGKVHPDPIKGLPAITAMGQGGLLDVTLHPKYTENGWIYLSYSYSKDGGANTAIIRGKLKDHTLVDIQELYAGTPYSRIGVHFGSRIVFDKQGFMYFGIGDRGQMKNAQDLSNSAGKVHRLHDDGRIPTDNPFKDENGKTTSIWSYGHRNPQGMIFHPETGALWEHEHGPRGGDEVNVVRKGRNYGWPEISYGINYNGTIITELTEKEGMEQPAHIWTPSIAPSGMTFVWSDKYPAWKGHLLSGSLSFSSLYRTEFNGEKSTHEEVVLKDIGRVRDVRMAPDGYIYISVERGGKIIRLLPE